MRGRLLGRGPFAAALCWLCDAEGDAGADDLLAEGRRWGRAVLVGLVVVVGRPATTLYTTTPHTAEAAGGVVLDRSVGVVVVFVAVVGEEVRVVVRDAAGFVGCSAVLGGLARLDGDGDGRGGHGGGGGLGSEELRVFHDGAFLVFKTGCGTSEGGGGLLFGWWRVVEFVGRVVAFVGRVGRRIAHFSKLWIIILCGRRSLSYQITH